jgi:hypothetical protein
MLFFLFALIDDYFRTSADFNVLIIDEPADQKLLIISLTEAPALFSQ